MTTRITAHASAKINLALHVTGQRPDGYHDLDSLVVFTRTGDHLRVCDADNDGFSITGRFGDKLDSNADNLVTRAVQLLRNKVPNSIPKGLKIELQKDLPIASGVGGGSSDAATMLGLLKKLADQLDLSQIDDSLLIEVASEMGADVPMCLDVHAKHIVGVGNNFSKIQRIPEMYLLLANPNIGVSTPDVFAQLVSKENSKMPSFGEGWDDLDTLVKFLHQTRNDLTKAACKLVPEIATLTNTMSKLSECKFARMSGSGATVFGVFASMEAAKSAQRQLLDHHPNYWIEPHEVYHSGIVTD